MKVLITGITGTLGTALTGHILEHTNWDIVGLSRDEQKQQGFLLAKYFPNRIKMLLGDVRDINTVKKALDGVQYVYHLAALKCVDVLEAFPSEAYHTNYKGTENIVSSIASNQKLIFVSTDKAVKPINAYGYSKAMAEKLVLTNKDFAVCRYGNVLGSRGSVLPIFYQAAKDKRPLEITNMDMTRFWITIDDVVEFVFKSYLRTGLCIPKMKAASVLRVANTIKKICKSDSPILESQIRPGEKLHEDLTEVINSRDAKQYLDDELEALLRSVLGV